MNRWGLLTRAWVKPIRMWPFPIMCLSQKSASLTRLFLDLAAAEDLRVVAVDEFYIQLHAVEIGRISLWNVNRWYSWAVKGCIWRDLPANAPVMSFGDEHRGETWQETRPSRYAMRMLRWRLEEISAPGFNKKWDRAANVYPASGDPEKSREVVRDLLERLLGKE